LFAIDGPDQCDFLVEGIDEILEEQPGCGENPQLNVPDDFSRNLSTFGFNMIGLFNSGMRRADTRWAFGTGTFVRDAVADVEIPLFHGKIAPLNAANAVRGGGPKGPDADSPVRAGGGEATAVGGESDGMDFALMRGEDRRWRLRLAKVPNPHSAIFACGGEAIAVRTNATEKDCALILNPEF
jgi:hypothetical protein